MVHNGETEIVIGRGEDYHFGHSEQFRSLYDYDPLTCLLPKLAIAEGNIYALSQLISRQFFYGPFTCKLDIER